LAVAYYDRSERVVCYPAVIFTQTVPKLALAPLFIVWFGVGITPKVLITALICLFPVLVNTVVGVQGVDVRLRQLMSSVSASPWQVFRMIDLPTALPHIFGGLQVGVTLAVVGALVGEWVGSDKGLGYLILYDNSQLRTAEVFASLGFVTAMGILLFLMVRWLERLALPHRPPVEILMSGRT
jgi:NitT/TauT family transport system permease protein